MAKYLFSLSILLILNSTNTSNNRTDSYKFPKLPKIDKTRDSLFPEFAFDDSEDFFVAEGKASFYAKRFHGRKTASGDKYNSYSYTGAHRKLPFGTIVRVKNNANGKTTFIKITDRGPFKKTRVIDMSKTAALHLDFDGVGKVTIDGFTIHNYTSSLAQSDESLNDIFIAYSNDYDIFKTHRNYIEEIASCTNFDRAVKTFNRISQHKEVFLFVKANSCKNCVTEYIIGTLLPTTKSSHKSPTSATRF